MIPAMAPLRRCAHRSISRSTFSPDSGRIVVSARTCGTNSCSASMSSGVARRTENGFCMSAFHRGRQLLQLLDVPPPHFDHPAIQDAVAALHITAANTGYILGRYRIFAVRQGNGCLAFALVNISTLGCELA